MCEVLAVSISGCRAWRRGGKPDRTRLSDLRSVALIKSIHAEVKGAYGSRRMHRELQDRGHRIGLRHIERLMREHGVSRHSPVQMVSLKRHGEVPELDDCDLVAKLIA